MSTQRAGQNDKLDIPDIDIFDDAVDHAMHRTAVLQELAEAKATGDVHEEERPFWWGVSALATEVIGDLEVMREHETKQNNLIFNLEQRLRSEMPRQRLPEKKQRGAKGGAR